MALIGVKFLWASGLTGLGGPMVIMVTKLHASQAEGGRGPAVIMSPKGTHTSSTTHQSQLQGPDPGKYIPQNHSAIFFGGTCRGVGREHWRGISSKPL